MRYFDIVPAPGHPRVYVNKEMIPVLRSRMEHFHYSRAACIIRENVKNNFEEMSCEVIESLAFVFLVYGQAEMGKQALFLVKRKIQEEVPLSDRKDWLLKKGQIMHTASLVYDWCYGLMDNDEKSDLSQQIMGIFTEISTVYRKKDLRDIMVNISESQLIRDCMAAAVAIYDEIPDMFRKCDRKFLQEYIMFRNFIAGSEGYPQGPWFGALRAVFDMHLIWLLDRMGYRDIFSSQIGVEPYYLMYFRRPDGKMIHDGDTVIECDRRGRHNTFPRIFMHASSYYHNAILHSEFLDELEGAEFHSEKLSNIRIDPVEMMLFYDDTVARQERAVLPQTKLFPQPIGAMICRTGWDKDKIDSDDIVVYFKIGAYNFNCHQHLDCGQFQIYYKGYLAIDSGGYIKYGDNHDANYNKRTVAHNCMLFMKQSEKMFFKGRNVSNDGGQIYFDCSRPSFNVKELFERGQKVGMLLNEAQIPNSGEPQYSYLRGLYYDAYGTKVNVQSRSFLFIRTGDVRCPGIVCIVDNVKSRFQKTYPLHMLSKPQVLLNNIVVKETKDGYNGRLFHTTAFPESKNLSVNIIGGDNAQFFVDSMNFELNLPEEGKKMQEVGAYRVEVTSKSDEMAQLFMNVMQITDGNSDFHYEVKPCREEHQAVVVGDYKIYFLNGKTYEYKILTKKKGFTHFVILNARLGYYSIQSVKKTFFTQCECRDNIMVFTLPKGEYEVKVLKTV